MTPLDHSAEDFDQDAFLLASRHHAEHALAAIPLGDVLPDLADVIRHAVGVGAGGKRLRPTLCAAAWRAVARTAAPAAVHSAGAAVELIHAYSLVHDDLPFMDDDDMRRGRPTTHRAHGVATATVAGAGMILVAFRVLADAMGELGTAPGQRRAAIEELGAAAGADGMVGGQWLDLAAEGRTLARPELERVHALKTGALIRAAVGIGGILAGANDAQRAALATYGASIGLAFQIADDLLDARGDSLAIGKAAGRDAELAKSTYPGLLGPAAAARLAHEQVDTALAALSRADIRSPELQALARFSVERDS